MKNAEYLQPISALAENGPALGEGMVKLIQVVKAMVSSNPNATVAEIQAQIKAALDDAETTLQQVEQGTV